MEAENMVHSDPASLGNLNTNTSSRYQDIISKSVLIQSGSPAVYQLKPKKEKIGTLRRMTLGEKKVKKINKTILLVGETGTGKSTLINALVNYAMGVKWEDDVWFQIVEDKPDNNEEEEKKKDDKDKSDKKDKDEDEEGQGESQTSDVIVYQIFGFEDETLPYSLTIIDTPGYGNTRGIEQDELVSQRLLDWFRSDDGVYEINAVGLVLKATENRVSDRLRYIFDSVLSLFGKNLEKNIVALITHSDGVTPENALKALKYAKIKCAKDEDNEPVHFLFNNRQNTQKTKKNKVALKSAWDISMEGMSQFTDFLKETPSKNLITTVDVLNERIRLKACIQNLKERVEFIEKKQKEIKQTQEALKKHENELKKNENFTVEVDEVYKDKQPIDCGMWALLLIGYRGAVSCNYCEENCHYPGCTLAWYPKHCQVMKGGRCTVCTGKCPVSSHVKENWIYVTKTRKVRMTHKDMKMKYEEDKADCEKTTSLLENLEKKMKELEKDKDHLLEKSFQHVVKLEQIALNVDSLSTQVHLDFLIEKMKEKGDKEKVQKLEEMKSRVDERARVVLRTSSLSADIKPAVCSFSTSENFVKPTGEQQIVEDDNKSQSESQTSDVIVYQIFSFEDETLPYSLTIIDTPGYGDTRGIEQDEIVSERLLDWFCSEDRVYEINAVGLVLKAAENREEIKQTQEDLERNKEDIKSLLENLENKVEELEKDKDHLLEESFQHVVKLEQIALNVDSLSTQVHFDFLIEKMKEKGDKEKVQKLEETKSRVDILKSGMHCMGLIIVRYEAHYGGVVCKLYDGVCGVDGRTVTGEESEEGWAEHAALWCACVQDQCRGCVVPDSHHLRPVALVMFSFAPLSSVFTSKLSIYCVFLHRAKVATSRPADQLILDRQRQDAARDKVLELTKSQQSGHISSSWLQSSDARFLRGALERRVQAALNQQEVQTQERRDRLRALLEEEEQQLLQEMEEKMETSVERQAKMRERAKTLRERRERDRQQLVSDKLEQLFRNQCEELRTVQSRRREQQVCSERAAQVIGRQERLQLQQQEEKMFDELWEADRRAKEERETQRVQRQQERNLRQLDVIRSQMEAAEQQRQKQRELREEEAALMLQQQEMQQLQQQREQQKKLQDQQTRRRLLDQGFQMKMKRLAREQQDELQMDLNILQMLLKQESDEKQEAAQRKL
ncbi:hypothetical protein L3Q82_002222 [Scortum barcoo]|uniref:Uncharacterized protein n=1 Tax=Scortum barcoo TaxID=214431 RepID=A0ACB8W364_9TELE|nr:hypothetical protein L3Q82_002222 [Scortum barcoo]